MKKKPLTIIIAIIAALLAFAGTVSYLAVTPGGLTSSGQLEVEPPNAEVIESGATQEAIAEIKTYQYTESWAHPTYKFSFKYPKDFIVTSAPVGGSTSSGDMEVEPPAGEVILINHPDKNIGVQIMITPSGESEDADITEELIRSQLPQMGIKDAQILEVGERRKGLAFMSDNPAFGGSAREVWFVWDGNLYQISTYAELDEFLKSLFATWEFK